MRPLWTSTLCLLLLLGSGVEGRAGPPAPSGPHGPAASTDTTETEDAKGLDPSARALGHGSYAEWRSIEDEGLSRDGLWAFWVLTPPDDGDTRLVVERVDGTTTHRVERGRAPRPSADSRFVVFRIRPYRDSLRRAEEEDGESPRDTLGILDLGSGEVTRIPRLDAFRLPEEEGARVAFTLEEPREPEAGGGEEAGSGEQAGSGEEAEGAGEPSAGSGETSAGGEEEGGGQEADDDEDRREGSTLVLRRLASGDEVSYEHVTDFAFGERGDRLAFVVAPRPEPDSAGASDGDGTSGAAGGADPGSGAPGAQGGEVEDRADPSARGPEGPAPGVYVVPPGSLDAVPVLTGQGDYEALAFDEAGRRLAFVTDRDDRAASETHGSTDGASDEVGDGADRQEAGSGDEEAGEDRVWALYAWSPDLDRARLAADSATAGLPDGWSVSPHAEVSFSHDGGRIFFESRPVPEEERSDGEDEAGPDGVYPPDPDDVRVDVWHWRDPYLQPMQKERVERREERDYLAVVLEDGTVVQLATEEIPDVRVGSRGDADVAVGTSGLPYRQLVSWDWPPYRDVYLVDVRTGDAQRVLEKTQASPDLSPDAAYLAWYDARERDWFVRDVEDGEVRNVTAGIDVPLWNEEHDRPYPPYPYGSPGWTEGDRELLVYDRYDVWLVDPEAEAAPRRLTEGAGRRDSLRFRRIDLEPDAEAIPRDEPLLLASFDYDTKASGFHRDRVTGRAPPEELLYGDRRYAFEEKAEEAERVLFTRETFREFPDLRTADLAFREPLRLSNANPQQEEYRWGRAELVSWRSEDGVPLDGILYVPDGLDTSERHPMIVHFYERMSDWLHLHRTPSASGASINVPFYVSRGYVVFVPDIVYEVGYPGESALDAVVPGVLSVLDRGFVDPDRIGVQGHSWGGYQVAYMVTKTDLFAAAEAGAPVSNMTSAYGGIRWGTGMSRMFQYERTQSRLGASLWDRRARYIENSPLFWADRVETPLLMLHNDADTAVPWYQGIELFVALRRLGKPAWMVNYNDQPHGVRDYESRIDWSIRMQQFFDHYLKGAPPPVWLVEGVPAVEKGETLGLDLIEPDDDGGGASADRADGGG